MENVTNNIMENTEVIETAAEEIVVKTNSGKGFKIAAGVGIGVGACYLAYKYVLKPVAKKIKANQKPKTFDQPVDVPTANYVEVDESED